MTHFGSTFCQGIRKTSPKNLAKFSMSLSSPTLSATSAYEQLKDQIESVDFKSHDIFEQQVAHSVNVFYKIFPAT
jgi:hypothetical protein